MSNFIKASLDDYKIISKFAPNIDEIETKDKIPTTLLLKKIIAKDY